jgi:hypothetical protein
MKERAFCAPMKSNLSRFSMANLFHARAARKGWAILITTKIEV